MAAIFEKLHGMTPDAKKFLFAAALSFLLAAGARTQPQSLPMLGYGTNFSVVTYFEPPHEQQINTRLSGAEAAPLPAAGGMYDLKKLKVQEFSTDGKLAAEVRAPQCNYAIFDQVAASAGHLELESGDGKFRVEGDGFLWQGKIQSLDISNHVHTVIKVGITNLTIL